MKTLLVLLILCSATFAAPTPTPHPIVPTGKVKFTWLPPAGIPANRISDYEFYEKIGTVYRLLGTTTIPQFTVSNIGTKPRTFAIAWRMTEGLGTVKDVVFPGIVTGTKSYMEVVVK